MFNEWMNDRINILLVKAEGHIKIWKTEFTKGQARGCIHYSPTVARFVCMALMVRWWWRQSFNFSCSENLACCSPSNHGDFAAFHSVLYMAYIVHAIAIIRVWCTMVQMRWENVIPVCILSLARLVLFWTQALLQLLMTVNQRMK